MKIIAFVGPLGTGKTHTILTTLKHLIQSDTFHREQVAYLLNDEGSVLDGETGNSFAQVIAITNGCFTCGDTGELRDQLKKLESDGVQLVLMEGFGMTGGDETVAFLKSTPYPFNVVSIIDWQNHWDNLKLYGATIASQVEAATLGILVTKTDEGVSIFDVGESPLGTFVANHNRNRVPLMIQRRDNHLPNSMLTKALTSFTQHHQARCSCCHHHKHSHAHKHDEHDTHGFRLYSFELSSRATLDQIKKALQATEAIRAKGAVGGRSFNMVQSKWDDVGKEDDRLFLTFYTQAEFDLTEILPLTASVGESFGDRKSYQLIRSFNGDTSLLLGEIRRLVNEIPTEAKIAGNGNLITHPEALQVAKDLSRCPAVKDEQFPITLNACLRYWLKALALLRTNEDKIEPQRLCVNKVELAASISWWVSEFADRFDADLVTAAYGARIGTLAAEGALGLRSLNEDPERAYWQCKELERAFLFDIQHGDQTEIIQQAISHCQKLSRGTTVEQLWGQVVV